MNIIANLVIKVKLPKKILDILKDFMYIRINSFEKSEFKELKMAVAMKADITDMVRPYIEKAKIEGKIEDAKAMKKESIEDKIISKVTGLSIQELKKYGIIKY